MKLSLFEFGEKLITTRDLDPLYVGLVRANLPSPQLHRWLLAYWMFYHVGVASWLSSEKDFWRWAKIAADNVETPPPLNNIGLPLFSRWPRGTERRHFRGPKAVKAVEQMELAFPKAEKAVDSLYRYNIAENLIEEVQTWPMFGKWISFKAVDMLDRVAGRRISIPADVVFMYDAPRAGLIEHLGDASDEALKRGFDELVRHFEQFKEPSRRDRQCGPAEVETILCKTKSYRSGYYWLGRDIYEQRHDLLGWGATAKTILAHYPAEAKRE